VSAPARSGLRKWREVKNARKWKKDPTATMQFYLSELAVALRGAPSA
jgi:hypothetical protein